MNQRILIAVIRRLVATGGECGAVLQLQRTGGTEFYEWARCNAPPWHQGEHACYDHEDNQWARFSATSISSRYLSDYTQPFIVIDSPWTDDELKVLREVGL